jgi:Fe-S-cluster-containing dehydrogenase component
MAKVFVIDVLKCSGCYSCQMACKDEHAGNDWLPYAKAQPDTGQFWIKVQEKTCGSTPKVRVNYTPVLCNHCKNAACMKVCPSGAIFKRDDGLVLIDPQRCSGCGVCVDACPYHVIYFNEQLKIAQKCTGCAHLLDSGKALPRCVEVCPTDALRFGEEEELRAEIPGAQVLLPEEGLRPRVYYRNIPGQFIAGTVYDPQSEEVIIGARCRAVSGGKHIETVTDVYGDFWFRDLAVGSWDVYIEAKGYRQKAFDALRTDECLNLGDIPLEKI